MNDRLRERKVDFQDLKDRESVGELVLEGAVTMAVIHVFMFTVYCFIRRLTTRNVPKQL